MDVENAAVTRSVLPRSRTVYLVLSRPSQLAGCRVVGRRGKARGVRRAGPLSSRHQSISDGRRRLPHVVDVSVARRRLRAGQATSAARVAQSQLHGTAARLRVVAQPPLRRPLFDQRTRRRHCRQ